MWNVVQNENLVPLFKKCEFQDGSGRALNPLRVLLSMGFCAIAHTSPMAAKPGLAGGIKGVGIQFW